MGMSAKEWEAVAEGAVDLLGESWHLVGKGRDLFLVPAPIGWWYQYVYYENTSVGQLSACTEFLGQQLTDAAYGDHGDQTYNIFIRDRTRPGNPVILRIDAQTTAEWASEVEEKVFAPHRGSAVADKWPVELAKCERDKQRWDEWDGPVGEPYSVRYAVIQAMCGPQSRDELLATLDWAIGDVAAEPDPDSRLSDRDPIEYLQAIRDTVAAGDRAGFEQVVLANRREELLAVGVPEQLIGPVEFPEPLTAWWEK
ncbi:hypothetical protein GOARA_007_00020 [Gordonia araii NBRC 100433]|uniref:Uncharacterized protein n=1 Tax=Gordonia araii NBRC 100433 TaxID=1073574 RepID=G7GXH4_9ACTN|nr:hypothetical protein [Gordonia araii]NNG99279.1 hypothetical protein [Gordonia araii NBRC 100433]GAB08299.1 hypothetical protein GOARA_007_00020 [Gordonia araii NBRC 100433]